MPRKAATHIQNTAPGPPSTMAVAAPARLPVPTCPAIAVVTAWKELIPCLPAFSPFREKPEKISRNPDIKRRICTPLNIKVKKFIKSNFDLYQKLINELHSPKYQKSIDIGFILLSNEFRGQIIHAFLQ